MIPRCLALNACMMVLCNHTLGATDGRRGMDHHGFRGPSLDAYLVPPPGQVTGKLAFYYTLLPAFWHSGIHSLSNMSCTSFSCVPRLQGDFASQHLLAVLSVPNTSNVLRDILTHPSTGPCPVRINQTLSAYSHLRPPSKRQLQPCTTASSVRAHSSQGLHAVKLFTPPKHPSPPAPSRALLQHALANLD